MSKRAIVFLCRTKEHLEKDLLNKFSHPDYDIIIVEDEDNDRFCMQDCVRHGFVNSCVTYKLNPHLLFHKGNPVAAWDRALYRFCKLKHDYEYVWFIEDDVFVPSLEQLIEEDRWFDADLLSTSRDIASHHREHGWSWFNSPEIHGVLPYPWLHNLVCICRMSKQLLQAIADHAKLRHTLAFIEVMIPTITVHRHLTMAFPVSLSHIDYRGHWHEHNMIPGFFYHPIKDANHRTHLRNILSSRV